MLSCILAKQPFKNDFLLNFELGCKYDQIFLILKIQHIIISAFSILILSISKSLNLSSKGSVWMFEFIDK